jgi:phenylacetate-coenzyme A ligase PaaK-like adenylate-forming protein
MAKLHGAPLSPPEYVDLNSAYKVAEWASAMLEHFPRCGVYTFASSAVRVCIAARERGLNLKGARFLVTGEPLTPQKKREIEETGATAVPVYGISEAGVIAAGCNHAHFGMSDSCHTYQDTMAIITHRLTVPHIDIEVDAFLFTTLLYESPKLLLNVGMGDYGSLRQCPCDCEFGKLGFDMHTANIRSYEKLTGEGVTFVDTDLIRILEKELPSRFGGRSTDYQLVECENGTGLNQLQLLVNPQIGPVDEKRVVDEFIAMLRHSEDSPESWAQSGSLMWDQANMVRIERASPIPTASGKILPFHMNKTRENAIQK